MHFVIVDLDHGFSEDGRMFHISRHGSLAQCEKKYNELRKSDQAFCGWAITCNSITTFDLFKRSDDDTLSKMLFHPDTGEGKRSMELVFRLGDDVNIICFASDHHFNYGDTEEEMYNDSKHFDEVCMLIKIDTLARVSDTD